MCCCGGLNYAKKYHTHDEFYTKAYIDALLAAEYYTRDEIAVILGDYYTQTEVNTLLDNYYTAQEVDTLLTQYYTQAQVDALIAGLQAQIDNLSEPIGTIKIWPAISNVPTNWMLCQGQSISKTTYSELLSIIGVYFGDDGSNFKIPDFRKRVPVGRSTTGTGNFTDIGEVGGEEQHDLQVSEMPSHTHGVTPGYLIGRDTVSGTIAATSGNVFSQATLLANGGGAAHNNIQPYLTINFIIKVL